MHTRSQLNPQRPSQSHVLARRAAALAALLRLSFCVCAVQAVHHHSGGNTAPPLGFNSVCLQVPLYVGEGVTVAGSAKVLSGLHEFHSAGLDWLYQSAPVVIIRTSRRCMHAVFGPSLCVRV